MKGRKIFEVTIILISIIVLFSLPLHPRKTKKETESGKHIILYRNYSTFNSAFLIINGVIDMVILVSESNLWSTFVNSFLGRSLISQVISFQSFTPKRDKEFLCNSDFLLIPLCHCLKKDHFQIHHWSPLTLAKLSRQMCTLTSPLLMLHLL